MKNRLRLSPNVICAVSDRFEDKRLITTDTNKASPNFPETVSVGISFYPDEDDGGYLRVQSVAPYTSAKQSGIQV